MTNESDDGPSTCVGRDNRATSLEREERRVRLESGIFIRRSTPPTLKGTRTEYEKKFR